MMSTSHAGYSTLAPSALPGAGALPRRVGLLLPAWSLCQRELVRFVRQPTRVIGAIVPPIFFWLALGGGMRDSFRFDGLPSKDSYIQYFFPGTIVIIILFTAIFSTISIIEDRKEGFLQSVLVSPASRLSIVLGKVLGGTLLGFGPAILFLLLAPFAGIHLSIAGFVAAAGMMFLVAFGLTGLGFLIAWRMSSTQGFHAIMNLFLMPLWFLSGALFPQQNAWWPLRWLMQINPLSYGLAGIRRAIYWANPQAGSILPGWGLILTVSAGSAIVMLLLCSLVARGRVSADWQ